MHCGADDRRECVDGPIGIFRSAARSWADEFGDIGDDGLIGDGDAEDSLDPQDPLSGSKGRRPTGTLQR